VHVCVVYNVYVWCVCVVSVCVCEGTVVCACISVHVCVVYNVYVWCVCVVSVCMYVCMCCVCV